MTAPKFTDIQHSELFIAEYKDKLLFCPELNRWFSWDGNYWAAALTKGPFAVYNEAVALEAKLGRGLCEIQNLNRIKPMLDLASQAEGLVVSSSALDQNPWLVATGSGTVDIKKGGGLLRPSIPSDYITRCLPTAYDPTAVAPKWKKFLGEITCGDTELEAYLQRVIGLALIGKVLEHKLFFLHGNGANGKGTFVNTLQHVFGPLAFSTPHDLLMGSSDETRQVTLAGVRLAITSETDQNKSWSEAQLKMLTGGDTILGRLLWAQAENFTPSHTFLVMGNHKPKVRGTDEGIWRRLSLIPFNARFEAKDKDSNIGTGVVDQLKGETGVEVKDMNTGLGDELKAEAAGILAWIVQGCLAYQEDGLAEPANVKKAGSEYRDEQDYLGDFISTCLEIDPTSEELMSKSVLYEAYQSWALVSGYSRPLTLMGLNRELSGRGFKDHRTNAARCWVGVAHKRTPDLPGAVALAARRDRKTANGHLPGLAAAQ